MRDVLSVYLCVAAATLIVTMKVVLPALMAGETFGLVDDLEVKNEWSGAMLGFLMANVVFGMAIVWPLTVALIVRAHVMFGSSADE